MYSTETNPYTRAASVAVLVNNDFHYMHLMSKGKDFDKSHNLAEEYYTKIDEEIDYLMELALEVGAPIYNYSKANNVVPEYQPEELDAYDYPTIIERLKSKISIYITALEDLRNFTDNNSIQSRLDDMIRDWEKELFYKLNRRTEIQSLNTFVNTGLDKILSEKYTV